MNKFRQQKNAQRVQPSDVNIKVMLLTKSIDGLNFKPLIHKTQTVNELLIEASISGGNGLC